MPLKPYQLRWHRLGFMIEIISYPFDDNRHVMVRLIPGDPTTMVEMFSWFVE